MTSEGKHHALKTDRLLAVMMDQSTPVFPAPALFVMGDGSYQRLVFENEDDRRDPHNANEFGAWFIRAESFAGDHDFVAQACAKDAAAEREFQSGEIDTLAFLQSGQWQTYHVA